MRVERALLEELSEKVFNIGYQGELNHTQVIISCPVMFRDYPDAVASMVVKPPQGDLYPVSLTRDGNDLTWDVSASDVAIPGAGILQLTFTDGEGEEAEIIKTVYGSYSVNASLVANGEAPDPVQSWLDEAGAALATFENEIGDIRKITTATEEDEGLALSPKTVVNGKVTEWEYIDLADPEVVTQAIDDWLDDHPEATTTVEDGAITEAKLNDSLKEDLAWQDDVDELKSAIKRPEFIVGNAEEVLSDRGESDEAVYMFRKTGGTKKAYNREQVKKIVGGTVAWNQLIENGDFQSSSGWSAGAGTLSVSDGVATVTMDGTAWNNDIRRNRKFIVGHKYLMFIDHKESSGLSGIPINLRTSVQTYGTFSYSSTWKTETVLVNVTSIPELNNLVMFGYTTNLSTYSGESLSVRSFCCFDLTAALGSTIADYLYTLETQTAGSGVALFRSLFDKSYYAYNSGSLESVNVSEHRCVGFNAFAGNSTDSAQYIGHYYINDGNSNYSKSANNNFNCFRIKVLPNTSYCISRQGGGNLGMGAAKRYLNENAEFISGDLIGYYANNRIFTTPANCHFIEIAEETSLTDGVCVNVSNAAKNGQYEPYQQFVYSMPNVTLRGIPKLVNNEIVFDGDELTPDGTVKRRYGIVDLGTLTYTRTASGLFSTSGINNAKGSDSGAVVANCISAMYTVIDSYTITGPSGQNPSPNLVMAINASGYTAYFNNTSYTDTDTFKTAMSGVYLVYELATPTTESVDPYQELQICNRYGTEEYIDRLATAETSPRDVAIPCGHETFYPVNVFDYIDELTKPDADFIADANIQSGKYFSVGNGLYISTQAIAQGETITPGTNCTAVSLADALNQINQ